MNKQLAKTILLSGIAMFTNYLINFLLTPYITETVGEEAYGFVSLSKNFITYAGIITIALNSYSTRFIAVSFHKGKIKKSNCYFSSVFFANCILAFVLFLIFCLISLFAEHLLNISENLVAQVKPLFAITGVTFIITTVFSVFASGAYIKNQLDKVNLYKCLSYVTEAIVLFVLFKFLPTRIWYVAVGSMVAALVVGVSNFAIHKNTTPEIKYSRKEVSRDAIKELVVNGVWNSLNSLGNTLNSGLDLIVSNLLLSPTAMGQIAIVKTMSGMFYALFQMVAQPFQPMFLKNYSEDDRTGLLKNLKLGMVVSGLFSNLAFAGFFALGKEYYTLWIPNQNIELVWQLTVLTLCGSVVEGAVFPLYYIYTLTVKNKIPCLVTIAGGVLNIVGMFVLIKYTSLGIFAVVLTTTVIMTAINLLFNPIYMSHCLEIRKTEFFPTIVRHLLSCAVMSAVFYCVSLVKSPISWFDFVLKAIICVVIGIVIHFYICGVSISKIVDIVRRKRSI